MKQCLKDVGLVALLVLVAFIVSLTMPTLVMSSNSSHSLRTTYTDVIAYLFSDTHKRGIVRLDLTHKCPPSILTSLTDRRGWMVGHEYHYHDKSLRSLCWRRVNELVEIQYGGDRGGHIYWVDLKPVYVKNPL